MGGTALYIRAADQAERDRQAAEADKKQREEEVAKLERQKKQQDETLAQMREMLATLKADSVEAKKLREQIEALEKNSGRTGSRPIRRTGTSGGASKAPPPPSCAPGDPLCSDI